MSRNRTKPLPQDQGLPPGGADSHVHLDFPYFSGKLQETVDRARQSGIATMGQVFLGPKAYAQGKDLFQDIPEVFFILGVHPHEASGFTSGTREDIAAAAEQDPRIKALGEMGLDFFHMRSTPEEQKEAFAGQLELAREMDLPVVIHSRDAPRETMHILKNAGFENRRLLWHCFGQDAELAREILELGWHISVPGSVTFAKNTQIREAIARIPADRLLLETDCPFIAPEPYRGKKNEPALVVFTALEVARLKGMDPGDLWVQCGDNCRSFFDVHP